MSKIIKSIGIVADIGGLFGVCDNKWRTKVGSLMHGAYKRQGTEMFVFSLYNMGPAVLDVYLYLKSRGQLLAAQSTAVVSEMELMSMPDDVRQSFDKCTYYCPLNTEEAANNYPDSYYLVVNTIADGVLLIGDSSSEFLKNAYRYAVDNNKYIRFIDILNLGLNKIEAEKRLLGHLLDDNNPPLK